MPVEATSIRPMILVRGFGGQDITDEQRSPYQGYNDGTVYPGKRGENYIYEGFLLRALKSDLYPYNDATNVVGYYSDDVPAPRNLDGYEEASVAGTVVIDPSTARRALQRGVAGTIWVYRYYDLTPRAMERYGAGLVRLIELIRIAADRHGEAFDGVDVVAHSMGGLVVREALHQFHDAENGSAVRFVHRIVTLGTPHRGIAFQRIPRWILERLPAVKGAADETASFDPTSTEFRRVGDWFPLSRILTVVGTNYRTYGTSAASIMNRLSSLLDEGSLEYNRSDGLVKQSSAQLPGAPRTFINKCHGGVDSLVTSREAFEIAMRFFHGTHKLRLWLDEATVSRGKDLFGRSEFYFGASIKPRYVDFDLLYQGPDAENCYGPFSDERLIEGPPSLIEELNKTLAEGGDETTGWAGPDRLIWEGWVDANARPDDSSGLVFRLDLYIGERDSFGIGFSDNVIFRKQYYIQAFPGKTLGLFVHTDERYLGATETLSQEALSVLAEDDPRSVVQRPRPVGPGTTGTTGQWTFRVLGTGFEATLRIAVEVEDV